MKIGFIGAGKAGNSVARYLKSPVTEISGFYSKTYEHAKDAADDIQSAAFLNLKDVISASDIIFITTPDSIIEEIWNLIKTEARKETVELNNKIFCHCSGSLSSEVFKCCSDYGASACAAHPMQAISSKETDLTGTFFTVDGTEPARTVIKQLLEEKGNRVGIIDSSCKKKYHMAASTASNLVIGLVEMSINALKECGFSRETAQEMLTPLIRGNINNVCENSTVSALTGPVERSDYETVTAHLEQLTGEEKEIYRLLSRQLIRVAQEKNPTRDYSKLKEILEEKDQ